jgi:hypothetical protein
METKYDVTPIGMMNNAKIWREFYYQNILSEKGRQMIAIYCLLISVEMFGKAYLVFFDKRYAKEKKLKEIGHNLKKLAESLARTSGNNNKIFTLLDLCIEEFRLDKYEDINILRYPKRGDLFYSSKEYFNVDNNLIKLTLAIEDEINSFFVEKWWERYK